MNMKKKIVGLFSICFVLLLTIVYLTNENKKINDFEDTEINKQKQIKLKEDNTLSMMLEQTAGAGDYEMETRSSWPTDGYVFNAELSKCENGGELSWDDTKKVVTMSSNTSDKCFVYFDIQVVVVNYNFTLSTTSSYETTSIGHGTLSINGVDITNKIGNTFEYGVGDKLIYTNIGPCSGGHGISIYDSENNRIADLSEDWDSVEYVMTGNEVSIESYCEGTMEVIAE